MLATYKAGGYNKLFLRPAWEFNIGFNLAVVTGSNLSTFIAAFQHFYTVCKTYATANAMNVRVIWNASCPNANAAGLTITQLYPGNAYCDSIGCDNYAESGVNTNTTSGSTTQFYVTTMVNMAIANSKTVCFPETGGTSTCAVDTTPNGLASAWTRNAVAYLVSIGRSVPIEFIDLWDVNDTEFGGHNLEFTYASQYPDNPAIIAAWKAGVGAGGSILTTHVP